MGQCRTNRVKVDRSAKLGNLIAKGSSYLSSVIGHRGVSIRVDTTQAAEFDIKSCQISDSRLEMIANNLSQYPFGPEDAVVGNVRIRSFSDWEILYQINRLDDIVVITIGGVKLKNEEPKFDKLLEKAEYAKRIWGLKDL